MDRHTQLRSFVLIAERGGFASAAAIEGVTPVVMGRRLNALEERLGVKLMHRSTRGLRLTDLGVDFLERCRETLRDFDELELSISRSRRNVTGDLTISAPAGFGRRHVAIHGPSFTAQHPGVRLRFNLTDSVVDLVRDRIDVAIRIGPVDGPRLAVVKLQKNRRVVCGSPDYFARHAVPTTPDDLLGHNCLTLSTNSGQQRGWTFRRGQKLKSVAVRGNLACSDGELLYEWLLQGLGLGWRSTWEVQPAVDRGDLMTVLEDYEIGDYDIQAVYPQQRYVPAKVQAFISHLRALYAGPGYWSQLALPPARKR